MHNAAAQAYQKTSRTVASPRELEASLLLKAASKLQAVRDDWAGRGAELDHALLYNRKLWTVLVTSATREDNPLPHAIKNNIANLGMFIFKRTMEVTAEPQPEKLGSLIQINRSIAEGLRGRP